MHEVSLPAFFSGISETRNILAISRLPTVVPSRTPDVVLEGSVYVLTSRMFVKKTNHIIMKN